MIKMKKNAHTTVKCQVNGFASEFNTNMYAHEQTLKGETNSETYKHKLIQNLSNILCTYMYNYVSMFQERAAHMACTYMHVKTA